MSQAIRVDTSGPFRNLITVKRAICVKFYDIYAHEKSMSTWRSSETVARVIEQKKPAKALELKFSLPHAFVIH